MMQAIVSHVVKRPSPRARRRPSWRADASATPERSRPSPSGSRPATRFLCAPAPANLSARGQIRRETTTSSQRQSTIPASTSTRRGTRIVIVASTRRSPERASLPQPTAGTPAALASELFLFKHTRSIRCSARSGRQDVAAAHRTVVSGGGGCRARPSVPGISPLGATIL